MFLQIQVIRQKVTIGFEIPFVQVLALEREALCSGDPISIPVVVMVFAAAVRGPRA